MSKYLTYQQVEKRFGEYIQMLPESDKKEYEKRQAVYLMLRDAFTAGLREGEKVADEKAEAGQ